MSQHLCAQSTVKEVEDVVKRPPWRCSGSRMDWEALTRDIMEGWADRIIQLLRAWIQLRQIHSHGIYGLTLSPPFLISIPAANTTALRRCMQFAIGLLSHSYVRKTPQEELLQMSVEIVMQRLCENYGIMFAESMNVDDQPSKKVMKEMLSNWETRITALMEWLDWTEWLWCDEVCS